jgi:hypothetical protein
MSAKEYPNDIIEIDYNFRRAESTGRKGKMVIVQRTASGNLVKTTWGRRMDVLGSQALFSLF